MQASLPIPVPAAGARSGTEDLDLRPVIGWSAWLLPSFADLIFVVCLLGALRSGSLMVSADGDPARHLAVGEHILATGIIPHQDVFSHTMAGQPFVPYEWLAEVTSAASFRWAGLAGPALLHGAVIALTFAVLVRHLRSRGHGPLLSFGAGLVAAMASGVHWSARPHVFTFLGAAVFGSVLDGWYAGRLSRRWLWALPVAMVLWANVHGGFLIGLILLGAYGGADVLRWLGGDATNAVSAGRRLRELIPAAAASLAAALLNPAGPALLSHVTGYFGKQLLVNNTHEYLSPDFHQANVRLFLGMLLAGIAGAAWFQRPALHEGLLLIGFTFFALYARRNIPLFVIVLAPLLAAQVSAVPGAIPWSRRLDRVGQVVACVNAWWARRDVIYGRTDRRSRGHFWPVLALAALLWVAAAQHRAGLEPLGVRFDETRQPMGAVNYLKSHQPTGNGFNHIGWGGYLIHELWPRQRVFIDGQTDFYGEALFRDYLTVEHVQAGWENVLDRRRVMWVLYATNSPLVRALAASPNWQVVYQDEMASVLARR